MTERRSEISADVLRHGSIEGFSRLIEAGHKPDFDEYARLLRGEIDPPVDPEGTRDLLEQKIASGEITPSDVNVIIHSPARRATETAELLRNMLHPSAVLRPNRDLLEVNLSMEHISREEYEQAVDVRDIIKRVIDDFLHGTTVDETPAQTYRRAERFLTYLRRVRTLTKANPMFVTHGTFARILELAIHHQGEKLDDQNIEALLQRELLSTKRRGVLEGLRIQNTSEGSKVVTI
jgi:broad specificity phosphatase PhoE